MKNYYVRVQTKIREGHPSSFIIAQLKLEVTGFNKLQIRYEWGKITAKYPEEFFNNHLTETKDEMREFEEDPSPYMISN